MKDILERALFAYVRYRYKRALFDEVTKYWPLYDTSGVFVHNARDYVLLRGPAGQLMAVYRIRPANKTLRRLWNYPVGLEHIKTLPQKKLKN